MHACLDTQLYPTICNPMDCRLPGSSVYCLAWDIPGKNTEGGCQYSPGDLSDPGIKPASPVAPALAGGFFTTEPPGKPHIFMVCGEESWPEATMPGSKLWSYHLVAV